MRLELTEKEINLIKESLTNTMIKYLNNARDENIEVMGKEWVDKNMVKSKEMEKVLDKISK
ncbi:hypothetical protein ACOT7R_08975 [Clostridium perfringens]|uniref:hypothetical protein n=1 Tax=Clostridium perfringens TaxID=1502 RepID=UPI003BAAACC5